jgi:hypothetical protein
MKAFGLMTTLLIFAYTCTSFAWTSKESTTKEYTFKYKLSGESLEIKRSAASYGDALEGAAKQCFQHYKGKHSLSESRGLDIIDVCANPRS